MNNLNQYTTEQLREEIKRRNKELRLLSIQQKKQEPKYAYEKGVVIGGRYNGYYSKYEVVFDNKNLTPNTMYAVKVYQGLRRREMPNIGDSVLLRSRISKRCPEFSVFDAKIERVINKS